MISEHSDRMIRARIDFALHVFENLRAVYPPWRAFSAVNPASDVTIQRCNDSTIHVRGSAEVCRDDQ